MGDVVHYDFGYFETPKESVALCPGCESASWLLLLSNLDTGESEYRDLLKIVAYECRDCGWRVDIKHPIAIVK